MTYHSATNLDVLSAPATLLRHNKLSHNDKLIWDAAYKEDVNGTWEVISETDYKRLRPILGSALPTMAISTLKKNKDGKPIRCKYRLVVLGNLDPNTWSKSDCFAPILSQMDRRLLLSIAVSKNCAPKQGDVSQA